MNDQWGGDHANCGVSKKKEKKKLLLAGRWVLFLKDTKKKAM